MTNDLIEVFILTYNRVSMLETAIRSVLNQTVRTRLTVVDNHSTDGTVEMIHRLKDEGCDFEYIRRPENGGPGANFETARARFSYPYVMIYHDDDALHPQYLECALRVLESNHNVDLIASAIREFETDGQLDQRRFKCVEYKKFEDVQRFCSYVYCANVLSKTETLHFSPVIFRREIRDAIVGRHDLYGKLDDTPAVFECVNGGMVVQMTTPMAWLRRHAGQDTKNLATGCRMDQILNVNALYKSYMEKSPETLSLYWWISGRHLRAGMNFSDGKYTTVQLLFAALRRGLLGVRSLLLMGEYVILRVLRIHAQGPLHRYWWKRAAALYSVRTITPSKEV